jgi:hypothetical protein
MNRRTCSLLVGFALLQSTGAALAQAPENDKAAAEALYEAGKSLLRSDVAAACDKFAASQELDPGVGTLLHLGACYEKLGRVASAWAAFREAASYAHRSAQPDREQIAVARAEKLEGRLPKLLIDTSQNGATQLEVTRDQKPVVSASLGVPIPVDPGSHQIAVSAPGKVSWHATVQLVEGKTETLRVPALEAAVPPPAALAAPPAAAVKPAPPPPAPSKPEAAVAQPSGLSTRAKIGIGVGAAGAVSLIVGSYFGLRAKSKWHDAKSHCDGLACDQAGVDLASSARVSGNVSTALFAVGAVAAGTGAVLFFGSPRKHESTIAIGATPSGALLSVEGTL